jgi:dephospho-CoA kinase
MTLVVGLTGGIGSGKSAVADLFAALGVPVVDADAVAHDLSRPGRPGHEAVLAAFGPGVLAPDGTLDRAALRREVFADPAARARLEAVLHPLIRSEARRSIATWAAPWGLVVVPLLFERGGFGGVVGRTIVVDCPEDEQLRRVVARSGLTEAEVRAIMATQLPRAERLARADDVIDNGGPRSALAAQVAALDARYRALAGAAASAK